MAAGACCSISVLTGTSVVVLLLQMQLESRNGMLRETGAVFFVGHDTPALVQLLRQARGAFAGSLVTVTCQLDGAARRCMEVLAVAQDGEMSGGGAEGGPNQQQTAPVGSTPAHRARTYHICCREPL